ncbi:hypothetical protein C8J57DRAFT_1270170 [Mycena rebaudengoi]|nr:hypothetical protein C8J57DRAFT_1270170 [Mycena rebaudengoi]
MRNQSEIGNRNPRCSIPPKISSSFLDYSATCTPVHIANHSRRCRQSPITVGARGPVVGGASFNQMDTQSRLFVRSSGRSFLFFRLAARSLFVSMACMHVVSHLSSTKLTLPFHNKVGSSLNRPAVALYPSTTYTYILAISLATHPTYFVQIIRE